MSCLSLLSLNMQPARPSGARRSVYFRGNLEAGRGAITPAIGGGAAFYCRNSTRRPVDADMLARIPAVTRPVTRALPAARYHPLGVEQERAGLDELGRIPSRQKEKEALWLT